MSRTAAVLICIMLFSALPQARFIFKLILRCCLGAAALFVLDMLLSPVGLSVGINPVTSVVCGVLGIPGVALLYGLAYILL